MNGKEQQRYYERFQNRGFVEKLVFNGVKKEYVKEIEEFAGELRDENFEPTQMYRIFNELVRINEEIKQDRLDFEELNKRLLVLRPRIAYTFARIIGRKDTKEKKMERNKVKVIGSFGKFIINAIDLITEKNDENALNYFKNFFYVYESILAYHKAAIVMKSDRRR